MKKILGGLLVLSLLSSPQLLKVDYIVYELYKVSDNIIRSIRTAQVSDKAGYVCGDDIDETFAGLDRNTKGITRLLEELDGVMAKMDAVMLNKAVAKELLTEEQMTAFAAFHRYYDGKTLEINETLAEISGGLNADSLKNDIMSYDGERDLYSVYARLNEMYDRQFGVISDINAVIRAAEETIDLFA